MRSVKLTLPRMQRLRKNYNKYYFLFAPLSSNVTGEHYKQARVHDEDYSKKPELVKMSLPAVKTSTCLKRGKNHAGETGFADWSDASDYG